MIVNGLIVLSVIVLLFVIAGLPDITRFVKDLFNGGKK